ncbi:TRAP transporter small permease subunit [Halomonas lysinitropha]|uniref:TRAP transporter small permease protein n=1 Tax=Halomonas lysinitropha TaxID=2607506 RepID=A0A5K1I9A3_9GAMM|nr:TRAP transporter small permease [Halomonas lysinitropha]VVZ94319.1 2,3-diketo-L-gulonate TRAP transporter small permease protein YiaM [Halomonas lysinitropha]
MPQKPPDTQDLSPDTQDLSDILEKVEEVSPERNALDKVIARGARLAAWLVLLAMGISVVEVFMRYGFNNPTSWVHETVVFLIAVIFALGGPAAMARNSHIRVKVLYDSAGPRLKCWMDRLNDLLTLAFCLTMSYAAFQMFWGATHNPLGEWSLERSGTSWNPPFPAMVKGAIFFALALMTLQAVLHLIESIRARPAQTDEEMR